MLLWARTSGRALGVLVVLLMLAGSAYAAPSSGDLLFKEAPTLQGVASAVGSGEVVVSAAGATGLSGEGLDVVLTRVTTRETFVANPIGEGVRLETPSTESQDVQLGDVAFRVTLAGEEFRGLAYTQASGRIDAAAARLDDVSLAAFSAPALVVDDYGPADSTRDGEAGTFTYAAAGARFPFITDAASVTGPFTLFLWDADLVVVDAAGDEAHYRSGTTRTQEPSGQVTITREHHLLRVTSGTVALAGAPLATWLASPTFAFEGTLRGAAASGAIDVDRREHTLRDVAVELVGAISLRPVAQGTPEPMDEGSATHLGTSQPSQGRYPGARTSISGDVTLLAIGPNEVLARDSNAGLITAVGVLGLAGAALLLVPQVKWAALGLLTPLYAKTERSRLLDNQSRERIYQAICGNPGINLSQIHRMSDLGWGVTVYHLKMMEKNGLIASVTHARDKCFFQNEPGLLVLRDAIAAIANREPVQRIVRSVADTPGLSQQDVIAATGLTQRTVSYYLGRLAKTGLVASTRHKNYVHYQPTDDLVRALAVVGPPPLATAAKADVPGAVHA